MKIFEKYVLSSQNFINSLLKHLLLRYFFQNDLKNIKSKLQLRHVLCIPVLRGGIQGLIAYH